MTVPSNPKIYHIAHMDNLVSIIRDGCLWSDKKMRNRTSVNIGMNTIKERRLTLPLLMSWPETYVGEYVPFYFCPRSIMLYIIHKNNNPDLTYKGGQEPIIHLEADLRTTVQWAKEHNCRWAFTNSNAGSRYFEDYSDLKNLDKVNWKAVNAKDWRNFHIKNGKQAEFLLENAFPWHLVECIGVYSEKQFQAINTNLTRAKHIPDLKIKRNWYY
ncbi:MAG: DUF4433 domain-containing protein [Rhodobacteraceae bacterium]|nr:DUF4433 domain-containing protein [Paracoccaceae bacterium]MYF46393.1 DUF4433 domain-containing protein [Paracoccaceae bacterium]MYI90593.1 DUF4433 domain-containing protein [Paracoccaceae bacterium]